MMKTYGKESGRGSPNDRVFGLAFCLTMTLVIVGAAFVLSSCGTKREASREAKFTLVVHGGAGSVKRDSTMSPERDSAYREALTEALEKGRTVLEGGGSSLDAVEAVVRMLEDSPLFNAGKGAVFTNEGKNELDASIMDGRTLKAGTVASVTTIKNPISAARTVMTKSWHVTLVGRGAELFAEKHGLEIVDPEYFFTERRWEALQKAKEEEGQSSLLQADEAFKYGTVGCLALDREGNLAAGTSTGGLTNKLYGRVGDSPIIGAGTYANNKTCAVSGTGQGEYFMRNVIAYDVSALMEYAGMSLRDAANKVILEKLTALGGSGGIIALDKDGNIAMPFNTEGMFRGYLREGEKANVFLYGDEGEEE